LQHHEDTIVPVEVITSGKNFGEQIADGIVQPNVIASKKRTGIDWFRLQEDLSTGIQSPLLHSDHAY
jgi:hypothetical protein